MMSDRLFLGREIGLEVRRAAVLAAATSACIYTNSQNGGTQRSEHGYDTPSARFPQAHVLVGSLFSVTALSQAGDELVLGYVILLKYRSG
jgi:hypothetical protein